MLEMSGGLLAATGALGTDAVMDEPDMRSSLRFLRRATGTGTFVTCLLSIYLSIYLFIYPSIHPSIYLSIYLFHDQGGLGMSLFVGDSEQKQ